MNDNSIRKIEVSLWLPLSHHRNDGTDLCVFKKIIEIDNSPKAIGVNYTFCVDDHWCIVTKVLREFVYAETFTTDTREEFLRGFLEKGWSLNMEGARLYDVTRSLVGEEVFAT